MRRINLVVIHCSATRASQDIDANTIDIWHRERGWSGIGYHYFIKRNGLLEFGRPENHIGAHTFGHNSNSLGICMAGGVAGNGRTPEDNFTSAQYETLKELINDIIAKYGDVRILGHRDLSKDIDGDGIVQPREWTKACPSFDVQKWLAKENIV